MEQYATLQQLVHRTFQLDHSLAQSSRIHTVVLNHICWL